MKTEEYKERKLEIESWPVKLTSYRIRETFHCTADNVSPGAALARTLSSYPVALMRGHGEVVAGSSVKQAVVYAVYVDIDARMQMQALTLSHDIVTLDENELFTPEEFDINRPWEHLRQKTLDDAARAKIDRAQFGLEQTQPKR